MISAVPVISLTVTVSSFELGFLISVVNIASFPSGTFTLLFTILFPMIFTPGIVGTPGVVGSNGVIVTVVSSLSTIIPVPVAVFPSTIIFTLKSSSPSIILSSNVGIFI